STLPHDDCGIPTEPSWSVKELLCSYPTPTISTATLHRLHELSALHPPPVDSPEFAEIKRDLEEMVRLVEAVKLVTTDPLGSEALVSNLPTPERSGHDSSQDGEQGTDLLKYASRTRDGYYVVEADRRR
ncbi:hypothetical protein FISHEDRAFT_22808, partial [Fistulina hepatica ATCC 64428]